MKPEVSSSPQPPSRDRGIKEGRLRTAIARVLGIPKLLPLTLGHVALLEKMRSPLLPDCSSQDIKLAEFSTFVWVCGRPWEIAMRRYFTPRTRIEIAAISGWFRSDFRAHLPQLKSYLDLELEVPKFRFIGDLHSPGRLNSTSLVIGLCPLLQMSEDHLLKMEVSQIASAACRIGANRGWATETAFPFAADALDLLGHFVSTAAHGGLARNLDRPYV